MHFVICVFIAVCALSLEVLFTEMFPKWFKCVLALTGAASFRAMPFAILIRKIATWTKWYAQPKLLPTFYIAGPVWCLLFLLHLSFIKEIRKIGRIIINA